MVNQSYGGSYNNPSGGGGGGGAHSADQNKKIFLGGLSHHTTDDTLRAFCSRFGNITDCLVMKNPEGRSRGFGFVTFAEQSSVDEFMRARPHSLDDRQIDPKRAMPREQQNSTDAHLSVKKLFVAGLRDVTDEVLRSYFQKFGNVTEVILMKDKEGKPRGFAFVTYDDYDSVDKAILEKPHILNGRTLDVKKAVPKEQMGEGGAGAGGGGYRAQSGGGGYAGNNGNYSGNYSGGQSGGGSWDSSMGNRGGYNQYGGQSAGGVGNYGNYQQPGGNGYGPQSGSYGGMQQSQPPAMTYDTYNSSGSNMYGGQSQQPPVASSSSGYMQQPAAPWATGGGPGNTYGSYGTGGNGYDGSQQGGGGGGPTQDYSGSSGGFGPSTAGPYQQMKMEPKMEPSPAGFNDGYTGNFGDNSGSYGPNSGFQGGRGGGGPMRGGRGGFNSPAGGNGYQNARPSPYSTTRGGGAGRGGGGFGGRGRGQ